MAKNILNTLMLHLLVGFITFYSFLGVGIFFGIFDNKNFIISNFFIGCILYILLAYKLIHILENNKKTLISISIIPLFSLLLWFITLIFLSFDLKTVKDIAWVPYLSFNYYSIPLCSLGLPNNASIFLIFALLPLLFCYIATALKKKIKDSKDNKAKSLES